MAGAGEAIAARAIQSTSTQVSRRTAREMVDRWTLNILAISPYEYFALKSRMSLTAGGESFALLIEPAFMLTERTRPRLPASGADHSPTQRTLRPRLASATKP
jgi:hypothetical protein